MNKVPKYIVLILLTLKGGGQLLSAFSRLDTPGGIATALGSTLYLVSVVAIFLNKKWALILASILLIVEILSTMLNNSLVLGDRVTSSIIDLVLLVLIYFSYKSLNKNVTKSI